MKPPRFDYARPETISEAVALLGEAGDEAKVLAGGQSLVPALSMRVLRPALIVDVNRVSGLDAVVESTEALTVGATVRQADPRVGAHPLMAAVIPHVGHFVTRNRGTICGSVAHADPASELATALVACEGTVVAESGKGRREIPARAFFGGPYATALEPDELVVETIWPVPGSGEGVAFEEFALRAGDYALCTALAQVSGDEVQVTLGAVVDRPTVVAVDPDDPGASAASQVEPWGSVHATPAYLKQLVRVLVDRAVARAREAAA